MKKYAGEEFLNKIYKDLVNSEAVKHTSKGGNKNEDIHTYIERLETITKKAKEHDNLRILKQFYYNKYIIKPENIPESYFKQKEQIALNRGFGHVFYPNIIKKIEIKEIISEQKASLDSWIDYFASTDAEIYPTWFKYYCFQGMVRIGYFDKKEGKYTKRTDSTIKPFIEINREAIAMVYEELIKVLNKEDVNDKNLEELLKSGSFSKIYAYCIKKLDSIKKSKTTDEKGIWKKYLQNSDPNILFKDIHGKGTGWCTAGGLETAAKHLQGGDFYVYFTKNENEEYKCPRIAIRMENNKIAEIRGIAENQNLESNMEKIVEAKLEEFPDKEEYKKKVEDMENLTYIYIKWKNNNNVALSREELKFIYEIDSEIIGFGYQKDPRIKEIKNKRRIKKDLAFIFNCKENQITFDKNQALNGNIVYYEGNLYLNNLKSAEGLVLPQIIKGDLDLDGLTSAKDLVLPDEINGDLNLSGLKSAKDLVLPSVINGSLNLRGLKSAEGLILPERINGVLYLKCVEGLVIPNEINAIIGLDIESAEGLVLPERINGSLHLGSLKSAEGLILPERIKGYLALQNLVSAEGLVLPKEINGELYLKNLKSTEGLIIPDELNCKLECSLAHNDINELKKMCKNNKQEEEIRKKK